MEEKNLPIKISMGRVFQAEGASDFKSLEWQ